MSPLNWMAFFCNHSNRHGFFCSHCKSGCGIATYTYYGLPCACNCHSYGIALYILLEVAFSTLFFGIVFASKMSIFQQVDHAYIFLPTHITQYVCKSTHVHNSKMEVWT